MHSNTGRWLVALLVLCDELGGRAVQGEAETECRTFYTHAGDAPGPACPGRCRFRTQCTNDPLRTSCTEEQDCQWLLRSYQIVNFTWNGTDGGVINTPACASCQHLLGCHSCVGSHNGTVVCKECGERFELDAESGTCQWKTKEFDWVVYGFFVVLVAVAVWILSDIGRAECVAIANKAALTRGLVMRRRSQLFMPKSDQNSQLKRYLLSTGLHDRQSSQLMGSGLTLFMNWFIFIGLLGLWFIGGTYFYAPTYEEEHIYLDPCRQQDREGWDFRTDRPTPDDRDGHNVRWALWNYLGATAMTGVFLYSQELLWAKMQEDERRPSLREYTVELTNVPRDMIDKDMIRAALGNWMARMHLNRDGIEEISIAYDVPSDKHDYVDQLLDSHIRTAAEEHTSGVESGTVELGAARFFFWIQALSFVLHGTPFRGGKVQVNPEDNQKYEIVQQFLCKLRGSGSVYIVMDTEALACAVAGMGRLNLPELCRRPIRVCKSPAEPPMIRWHDYCSVSGCWRLFRLLRTIIMPIVTLNVWFMFFAAFLSFELVTVGYDGVSKSLAGIFVGMLVPIGNGLFGAIIDWLMNKWGFRDEDDLRMWRQVLNVLLNGAALSGEIYLVHKKVYSDARFDAVQWGFVDFLQQLRLTAPHGINPNTYLFQQELSAIFFPTGMLVPIITIPLLCDFTPYLVGRLRVKLDPKMTSADAERILRPGDLDPVMPYTDFIINMFLLTYAAWVSPGTYLITLWATFLLWLFLLYLNTRMNVLRWQARTYFGGKRSHRCESFLLAIPLGFLCAALDHQVNVGDHSGMMGLFCHVTAHSIFVQYILATIEPTKRRVETSYKEMMSGELAPVATYLNTNPIEVLKRQFGLDPDLNLPPMIFFRSDKWYLQKSTGERVTHFAGEENVPVKGVWSATKAEAKQLARDMVYAGADTARSTGRGLHSSVRSVSGWAAASEERGPNAQSIPLPICAPDPESQGATIPSTDRGGLTSAGSTRSQNSQSSDGFKVMADRTSAVGDHLERLMGRPLSEAP